MEALAVSLTEKQDDPVFDRRMALIGFDNAIEITIAAYLSLKPIHRRSRSYLTADVNKWMANYHTKFDFLHDEISARIFGLLFDVEDADERVGAADCEATSATRTRTKSGV